MNKNRNININISNIFIIEYFFAKSRNKNLSAQ